MRKKEETPMGHLKKEIFPIPFEALITIPFGMPISIRDAFRCFPTAIQKPLS